MIKVGVIGLGTVGSRVAEAVRRQPDMMLAGVAVVRPSPMMLAPWLKTTPAFWVSEAFDFERPLEGSWRSLATASDVIVDCGPRGTATDRIEDCRTAGAKVVIHGGEPFTAAQPDFCVADLPDPPAADVLRIPSCNTTAMLRVLSALRRLAPIKEVRAVLARASTDADKGDKGDAARARVGLQPTHHGDDIRRFWPEMNARTLGSHVPTNRGHLMQMFVRFEQAPSLELVKTALGAAARVVLLEGFPGWADDGRRAFAGQTDAAFAWVWVESLDLSGDELALSVGLHMEAIVVPDTIDAVRRLARGASSNESQVVTDRALGVRSGSWAFGST